VRHAHAVELAREGVAVNIIQPPGYGTSTSDSSGSDHRRGLGHLLTGDPDCACADARIRRIGSAGAGTMAPSAKQHHGVGLHVETDQVALDRGSRGPRLGEDRSVHAVQFSEVLK
jgi:hypothetical protein